MRTAPTTDPRVPEHSDPTRPGPKRRRLGRWLLAGTALAGAGVVLAGLVLSGLAPAPGPLGELRSAVTCPIPSTHDPDVIETVYEVGAARAVPDRLMRAAFAAGWVESHMHNLPCGDRDSVGVFQQRPSQDWGSAKQIRDVEYAATQFFDRAEQVDASEPGLSPGDLAQRVQRSAYPDRYSRADAKAEQLRTEAERLAEEGGK